MCTLSNVSSASPFNRNQQTQSQIRTQKRAQKQELKALQRREAQSQRQDKNKHAYQKRGGRNNCQQRCY